MGRRLLSALLSLVITCLKFAVNMLTIGISFLTKKEIPLVDDWTPNDNSDERQESIERQKRCVSEKKICVREKKKKIQIVNQKKKKDPNNNV